MTQLTLPKINHRLPAMPKIQEETEEKENQPLFNREDEKVKKMLEGRKNLLHVDTPRPKSLNLAPIKAKG